MISSSITWKQQRAAGLIERQRRVGDGQRGLDLPTWMICHRRVLTPGRALNLREHHYLVDVYQCQAQRLVLYKASQMGASEYAISYALHAADVRQATVLYLFPTDVAVSDFSSARIGPAIEASAYLARVVVDGAAAGGRRGADRVTLKRVRDRFVYLRGAKVDPEGNAPQLKSIDADVLVFDEVDEMDPRALAIAQKRLGHSRIAEQRWISTPTFTNVGVHAAWLESDQREWYVRCAHCGERQPLRIEQVVVAWDALGRPAAWHGQREGGAWVACRRCQKQVDRLGPGEWVAAWPGRETAGYHLTKLFSPRTQLIDVVVALQTADESKRKETFNQDLGEPYIPRGGQLTDEVLDACRREYAHGPTPALCVMGVDVGKVLHVVVRTTQGECRQAWAGEVESWDELGRVMRRFNVRACVIDALPETTKAREFQAQWPPGMVWLAFYVGQAAGARRADESVFDVQNGLVHLDRTRTLDGTLARFYDGSATLPAHARDVRDFYAHLKALVRVLEKTSSGEQVLRYVESGPDHLAHAENYCRVASSARPGVAGSQGQVVSVANLGF